MVIAYIGLGSNLGNKQAMLSKATKLLDRCPNTMVTGRSGIYESIPMGNISQPNYFNAVVRIRTRLNPNELLKNTQRIERQLGRRKKFLRWGPRPADLDILAYGEQCINQNNLVIPHPGVPDREFVLFPLLDIDSYIQFPNMGSLVNLIGQYKGPKPKRIF